MGRGLKIIAAVMGTAIVFLCSACAAEPQESPVPPIPSRQSDEEPEVGLLGFEDPVPDGFTFEIMPDADDNIYEMIVDYRLGDKSWGSEVMTTEDGSSFGLSDVVMKVFKLADLTDDDTIPAMTLAFTFKDKAGIETPADNEYTVEAPQVEGRYLVHITGSRDDGYVLSNQ